MRRAVAAGGLTVSGPILSGLTVSGLILAGLTVAGLFAAAPAASASTVVSVAPAAAAPGASVTFTVSCASSTAASATLAGQSLGLAALIPMDATTPAGHFSVKVTLPGSIRPGRYRPQITCAGSTSARATFRVTELAAAASTTVSTSSGSTAMNSWLTVAGLVLIGVGAIAGGIAIRRRASASGDRP